MRVAVMVYVSILTAMMVIVGADDDNYDADCQKKCQNSASCASDESCCDGVCVDINSYDGDCRRTCPDYDMSYCDSGEHCCDEVCFESMMECIGIDEDQLFGIGVAAFVVSLVLPILGCCCGGFALFWLIKRRRERIASQGQVHQPGMMMPPQGQVYQPGMQNQ